ncbi:hypothetical protein PHYBOEH_002033 [Phytophthora boehmeriae]|uniref:Uncharacterized protein n=1 Tax=Phytophthora boehmeriae TaxID=109152 RepID=A0A8T1V870_9STRA|nr:hypothetical protein PHYBOEH_002033 [Phytophthora boehmeriae]
MNFFEATETQAVLRDVFAFIDAYESQLKSLTEPNCALLSSSDGSESPRKSIGDRGRTSLKPRAKDAPNYERKRRQRKKHERESLRRQVAQYEAQLELLRLRQTSQSSSSDGKWGWLDAAMQEEEKRREAEELNRRLKGCLVERLQTAKALSSLVAKESTLASRIQVVVGQELPFSNDVPTRFSTHEAIKMHLKRTFDQLYLSANSVFGFQDESSLESFSTSACVKKLDSTAGMCIELSSTTPLGIHVQLIWILFAIHARRYLPKLDRCMGFD